MVTKNKILDYSDSELESLLCPSTTLAAWTFKGKHIREAIEGKRVLNPSIDLSNICNLNCPYCYIEKIGSFCKKKNNNELNFEEYKFIIDKLFVAGAKTINIIGAGEPTIDKNFIKIAEYIKSLNINILVATNGIEIAKSNSLISFLNDIESSIVIKVNSFRSGLQDILVGKKGYSEFRDKALDALISNGFNLTKPTRLGINTLLMKANIDEVFDIFKYCRKNNITYIAGNYMPTGRTESSIFQGDYLLKDKKTKENFEPVTTTDYSRMRKRIIKYDLENNFPIKSPDAYISGLPCIQGLGIQIDNTGKIWHCPARLQLIEGALLSKAIDNVTDETDFKSLWQSDVYFKKFRTLYNGICPYKII
jgi:MoaA/NifB/PqqE/SkfB family radical SAM enzyme